MASVRAVPNPVMNPYQPAPSGYSVTAVRQTQNCVPCCPSQITQPRPSTRWTAQGARPHPFPNVSGAIHPAAPRSSFSTVRPGPSHAPQAVSAHRITNTSAQTTGQRPAAAASVATTPVLSVPQYKYTSGVQNPQQHLNAQLVPQPAVRVQDQEPWTASMLVTTPQEQKQMLGERLFPLIQAMHPTLAGKITGMLLEIDNSEPLHMLESPESLRSKADEAVALLQAHQAKEAVQKAVSSASGVPTI